MKGIFWLGILGITSLQILSTNPSFAQSSNIVTDNSLGNEASRVEKNSQLRGLPVEIIRGGAQRGINLFHSFREFNVSESRGVYFFSPNAEVQNILTRVTGSNHSEILGTLGTFGNSQPNLFLINPNGILFGENASLDLEGSFVGTTANGLQFGELGVFSVINPEAPALLTVNPSALFFNQINQSAAIQNNSVAPAGVDASGFDRFGLRVADGKSLLLVGGNINFNGGRVNALGGRVELGGLTETGTVALDINGGNFRLGFPENVTRGDVSLINEAGIYIESDDGGDIVVNTQNLEMTTQSSLNAGIGPGLGSDNSKAGNIDVNATGIVNLSHSNINNAIRREAKGEGGKVNIIASTLLVKDGAQVGAGTFGEGKGGNLSIDAQDVQIIGRSKNDLFASGLFAPAEPNSKGDAGDLTINADTLLVQDGAQVGVATFGEGKGGNLIVNAQDIKLIGTSKNGLVPTILGATLELNSTGEAGNVTITANTLLVQDGAQVSVITSGEGKGGNLIVNAQDVQLIGTSKDVRFGSGLFASGRPSSTEEAGNITITTNTLLVRDGAQVSAATLGGGKGGNLTVNAQDVRLIGTSEDGNFPSSLSTQAERNSTGDAGDLTLSTDKFLVQDGAFVSARTFSEGKGGNLTVNAQDIQLIGTTKDGFASGLFASAELNSTGDAGDLIIETNKLLVQDGARVSTATGGKGKGGDLIVDANTLQLKNDATIRARSTDSGISGNIEINVKNDFNADNGQVITQSQQSSGGNIDITAGKNIFLRNDSNIRTTLQSTEGSGGDITLTANGIVALEDSDILAFAPEGRGGNITFNTSGFLSDPLYRPIPQTTDEETLDKLDGNNRVDVNASGSISTGNISGIPDISFLQDNLTDLPSNQIDTNALIANSCIARSTKRQKNSFTIMGSGGLRNSPVDGFVSRYSTGDVRNIEQISRNWEKGDPIVEPTGAYQLADGRLILGRFCE